MGRSASFLTHVICFLVGLVLLSAPQARASSIDTEDAQVFITGFNSFQKKDYQTTIDSMSLILSKYPDTPLRDMTIYWLAKAYYKTGQRTEAARTMATFLREYPDNSMRDSVEPDLLHLAQAFARGEKLPPPPQPVMEARKPTSEEKKETARPEPEHKPAAGQVAAAPPRSAGDTKAPAISERERADAERLAAEKASEEREARIRLALKAKAAEKRTAGTPMAGIPDNGPALGVTGSGSRPEGTPASTEIVASGKRPPAGRVVGQPAPPFTVAPFAGAPIALADLRGKVVLLHFFAPWSAPCRGAVDVLNATSAAFTPQGLRVVGLGVYAESDRDVERFAVERGTTFPVAAASDELRNQYGVHEVPVLYLINKNGIVTEKYIGCTEETMKGMEDVIRRLLAE